MVNKVLSTYLSSTVSCHSVFTFVCIQCCTLNKIIIIPSFQIYKVFILALRHWLRFMWNVESVELLELLTGCDIMNILGIVSTQSYCYTLKKLLLCSTLNVLFLNRVFKKSRKTERDQENLFVISDWWRCFPGTSLFFKNDIKHFFEDSVYKNCILLFY